MVNEEVGKTAGSSELQPDKIIIEGLQCRKAGLTGYRLLRRVSKSSEMTG